MVDLAGPAPSARFPTDRHRRHSRKWKKPASRWSASAELQEGHPNCSINLRGSVQLILNTPRGKAPAPTKPLRSAAVATAFPALRAIQAADAAVRAMEPCGVEEMTVQALQDRFVTEVLTR